MPTENPKISLYVPQTIYDRFKKFQEERELSMSQAGIVILAEYFGLKQIIERTTEGFTIGGVTFDWVKNLENQIIELKKRVDQLETTGKPPLVDDENVIAPSKQVEPQQTILAIENKDNSLEEDTVDKETLPLIESSAEIENLEKNVEDAGIDENKATYEVWTPANLAKRLKIAPSTISRNKFKEDFTEWTRERDPENIGWITLESGQCKPERPLSPKQVLILSIESDDPQEPVSTTDSPVKEDIKLKQSSSHEESAKVKSAESTPHSSLNSFKESRGSQLNLLSEPPKELILIKDKLLAKRLKIGKSTSSSMRARHTPKEFYEWSKQKDFDEIGWIPNPNGAGYIPGDELDNELLSRLQKWIEKNS